MRFKPVKLTLVFWALAGASLTVSGAALADSSSAPAVSNSAHESEIISIDGTEQTEAQDTHNSNVDNINIGNIGQSTNANSQSIVTVNSKATLTGGGTNEPTNEQTALKTVAGNDTKNSTDTVDAIAPSKASLTADSSSTVSGHGTVTADTTIPTNFDSTKSATISAAEISVKISQSDAASKAVVRNNKAVLPAALVQDSGGLTAPVAEAPSAPAHQNPATPIGVVGEFNALMHSVVPVSQIGVISLLPAATGSKTWDFGLTSWIILGVVVCAGLFVTNLRRSGFTNGARSDIPNFSFLVANSQRMGLVRVTVNSSFFSGVNS